jgi:nicotinamide-nucleotide amidase
MITNLNAEVISIGTEILLGELTDTNSVFIARALRDLGINLYYMTSVGDNQERIAEAIRIALSRSQIVITCGGLGPTVDDMTRPAVATATGRELVFHQHLLDQIAVRFAGFRVTMTENNRRQAYLPQDSIAIENPVGTAPAFMVEHGDGIVISLPGVPREMKFLMTHEVIPHLQRRYALGVIKAHTLKSAGIGESWLDDMIGPDLLESGNPTIGLAAHHGEVDIRITAKAESPEQADWMIAQMEAEVRRRVGTFIFGEEGDILEQVLVDLLRETGLQIAIVQAGMSATVADLLRAIPGGRSALALAEDFPDPDALRTAYALPDEISSLRDIAVQVAERAGQRAGAAVSAAIVCLPDVDEGSDAAVSTAVAVYGDGQVRERVYGFGGRSDVAREWVSRWVMATIWRMLRERADEN